MAIHIRSVSEVPAPLEKSFAYVANYRNVGDWLFGITKFTPVGDLDYGLGAVFDGELHVGATLHSTIKVNGFEENRLISFETVKGFQNESEWTFEAVDAANSRITCDLSYVLPGGLAGRALGKVIAPFIKMAIRNSSDNLARVIPASG